MDKSVIILAGGSSSRFNADKGVLELGGKPLLRYAVDGVKGLADEVVVVTNSKERAEVYAKIVPSYVRFAVDSCESKGPLVGALTGFEAALGEYSLLLPFAAGSFSAVVMRLLPVGRWTAEVHRGQI